jgi:short-subunit dehydrogenase
MMLKNKVVLITGASSGIGAATARLCVANGARVLLVARRADRLEHLAQELGIDKAVAFPADITCQDDVRAAFQAAFKLVGGLDIVVNNAGRGMYVPVAEMDITQWNDLWTLNVQGALYVMQEAARMLSSGGVIINVSSIAGKVSSPRMGGYSATKFALGALSDALRLELADQGVRVVTVYPGSTQTEFRGHAIGSETMVDKRVTRSTPEQVAQAIVSAMLSNKTRVWVRKPDRIAAALAQALPRLSDRLLRKTMITKATAKAADASTSKEDS